MTENGQNSERITKNIIVIAAGVVLVELLSANYMATRSFLQAEGDFEFMKSLLLMVQSFNPMKEWEHVQAANAFAVCIVMLFAYIHYFIRLLRTDDLYARTKELSAFVLILDLAIMFIFIGFARSSANLAGKNVTQVDTAWILAVVAFALLFVRLIWSFRIKRSYETDPKNKYYAYRYYLSCGCYYFIAMYALYLGKRQPVYVENFDAMLKEMSVIGILCGVALGLLSGLGFIISHNNRKGELVFNSVLGLIVFIVGFVLVVLRNDLIKELFEIRAYFNIGSLLLLITIFGFFVLVWQQLTFEKQNAALNTILRRGRDT